MAIASSIIIYMKYFTELRYYDYKFLLHYPGHAFKWTISGILIVVLFFSAAEGILTDLSRNDVTNPYLYIPQMFSLLGLIISLVYYHHMEYWDRPHLAWWLLLYWIMAITGEVFAVFTMSQSIGFNYIILRLDIGIIVIILYSCCAAGEFNVLRKKMFISLGEEGTTSKDILKTNLFFMKSYVNLLSNITVWWLNSLVLLSRKQTIEIDDLGCLPEEFEGKRILHAFNKSYRCEQSYPFVTVKEFFSNGFILMFLISVILMLRNLLAVYSFRVAFEVGIHLKTAIQNFVYEKALRLSSLTNSTAGKTINYISADSDSTHQFCLTFGNLISNPLQILVGCSWLFYSMGLAGVVGVGCGLLAVPLILKLGRMQNKIQRISMHYSDIRGTKTNELLQGIKLLKLCGWEELFASGIKSTRSEEMKQKSKLAKYFILLGATSKSLPYIVTFAMFAVYSKVTTTPLTPEIVFTTIALTSLLIQPLSTMPSLIKATVGMITSTKRLEEFMRMEEMGSCADHRDPVDDYVDCSDINEITEEYEMNEIEMKLTTPLVQRAPQQNYKTTRKISPMPMTGTAENVERNNVAIEIINGYFSWGTDIHEVVLNNINVKFETGTLTVIVGKIGAGKSSLLSAILGEMNTVSGRIQFKGKDKQIAYVAQKAWLQNATLRDNILFGEKFDQQKYNTVVEVCALTPDLHSLPGGDLAEIGERGINISGGQKHRICLARALYSNTDVVILDDPLSALDVHVSGHVMEKAILGFLCEQQRTVILVTHQIQHLEHANQVLVMDNGQIIQKGTLREIRVHNRELYRQIISTISDSENETKDELVIKRKRKQVRSRKSKTSKKGSPLVEEERPPLTDGWTMLYLYCQAFKFTHIGVLMFVLLLQVAAFVCLKMWIADWSQAGQDSLNKTRVEQEMVVSYYLPPYGLIICFFIITVTLTKACVILFCISAAKRIFSKLLYNVMYSPMRFFETTPVGRLMNRFSSDMRSVDLALCISLSSIFGAFTTLIGTYIVNAIISPYFILLVVPIGVIGVLCIIAGVKLPRDIKRLDTVSLSPILSHFSETCGGLSTIRAFRADKRFTKQMRNTVNANSLCKLYYCASLNWNTLRINTIGSLLFFVFGIGALLAFITGNINPSSVGLAITTGLMGSNMINLLMTFMVRLLSCFNGVERVLEYANVTPEEIEGTVYPPDNWPNRGSITIQNMSARYANTLDPVLTNVNVKFRSGKKIGICGRTGSGKSSLTLTLLRMIDIIEGRIIIDGIDISDISVLTLRRRISIIPQDPVLFCGTVRFNLDPERKYGDAELWYALEIAQMKGYVIEMDNQLDTIVTEGGDNISTGQRQLICLARAFLRKSRILIMDEATASVDLQTDSTLQSVIATAFSDKTVLTIAHRISTILDSDTVLVLSEGRVVEYGTPQNLLRKDGGMFASLVKME
uniref:ATP-binding cassette sub-family C member 9-like n=1 Tax=Saccoglossus kowalevskii TaxID=10224 RepID=A0ABM0GKB1_SACKO|nr:PREDICTED: ATP-binding cassette sub-family C member 9-like [Saccoglossus kowalevskii]